MIFKMFREKKGAVVKELKLCFEVGNASGWSKGAKE